MDARSGNNGEYFEARRQFRKKHVFGERERERERREKWRVLKKQLKNQCRGNAKSRGLVEARRDLRTN